ncbi:MAG: hypothetical protein JWO54_928 [Candidatus Saccharibacteria bacterium]|nr:hypothetical protein [Candidatus Saccharibacteria bacterium]
MSKLSVKKLMKKDEISDMSDPNALLSTLSQSSAAMVAIIGGFLVSRLVSLSSEREGLKRQINAINQRLAQLNNEYKPVHEYRYQNSKSAFFGFVIEDLVKAESNDINYEKMVSENVPRGSSVKEMLPYAEELHKRVKGAYKNILDHLHDNDRDDLSISDLKARGIKISEKDEPIYEEVLEHIAEKLPSSSNSLIPMPTFRMSMPSPAWRHEIDARRLDESIREESELESKIRGSEQELKHLKNELDKIAHPIGVNPAVFILAVLSVVGILLPVIIMATDPKELGVKLTIILIGCFAIGLAGVLAYIIWYLNQLKEK